MEFVRVVHRQGWDVEVVSGQDVTKRNFPAQDEALEFARSLDPDWIELGEVVVASEHAPQHHRWTTLRRSPSGAYETSGLNWGGPGRAR